MTNFALSEADKQVVYLADQEIDQLYELYSVPVAGGAPVRLNTAGQTPLDFAISPVGGRVAYLSGTRGFGTAHLYSVPIGGGTPTMINAPESEAVSSYQFSPDGNWLFYTVDTDRNRLYRSSATGGTIEVVAENVVSLTFDPTGQYLLYTTNGWYEQLHSVRINGGTPTLLGGIFDFDRLLFSPDSKRVVYYQPGGYGSYVGLVSDLIGGGNKVQLVDPDGDQLTLHSRQLSADGVYVLYAGTVADVNTNQPRRAVIRRAGLHTGGVVTLDEVELPAGAKDVTLKLAQAPGGGPLVYGLSYPNGYENGTATVSHRLVSVPVEGGSSRVLYGPTNLQTTDFPFALRDDGSQLLFRAGVKLYRESLTSAQPAAELGSTYVAQFAFTDDGGALFRKGPGVYYAAPGAEAVRLDDLPENADTTHVAQLGSTVVFRSSRAYIASAAPGAYELFAAELPALPPPPQAPTTAFSADSLELAEGASAASLEVYLAQASSQTVSVAYTVVGGTAVAGVDYTLGAGPLLFAPGETTKSLPLSILDRPGVNGTRTLVLQLETPTLAAAPTDGPTTVTITIRDDEFGVFLPLLAR